MLDSQAKATRELFLTIQDELDHRGEDLREGLSFLDMKNDTLLSYMIDVCNIILRRLKGESIENHNSVERCVEYRVILEKIKAIDQKLAYQLNKLITLPEDAVEEDQKINVNNLDINIENVESDENGSEAEESEDARSNSDDEEEESVDEDDGSDEVSSYDANSDENGEDSPKNLKASLKSQGSSKNTTGVYKPPKLRSVAYTEDYKKGDRGRRKDYSDFYQDDDPHDILDNSKAPERDERTRFEEDNYTRLPDENPKKAKRKLRTKEYRRKGSNKHKRRRK